MKKILATTVALFSLFYLLPSSVSAQYGQYGGPTPSVSILINKMVGVPDSFLTDATKANYVDNLSPSDPRFQPSESVFFKLAVKNTSNITITNVTVKDFVPSFLTPLEGPGTYNSTTRTITFSAGDFAAGEEKIYYIKMQVLPQDQLPADKGLFCVVNKAQAFDGGTFDDDSSQLCIEKQVLGAAQVPSAGPELGPILIGLNLFGLGTGLWLRKRK